MALATAICLFHSFARAGTDEDPLNLLGFRATEGAAAGYVVDRACGSCHAEKYQSYQHVGMAQSFAKPSKAKVIEEFGREFYHEPSQRYYRIDRNGEELVFHRYQRDAAGKPINEFQTVIDWVMGSGNRARSYLYRNNWGEMYMLPLGWYSENKEWGMSPGFEFKDHPGVLRRVPRQCMFCHNAFAEVPVGGDLNWQPHQFPKELPQGTGCQRCHGPGAEHIRVALKGAKPEAIRGEIVNPAKLPPQRRDSVCFQCHMLPAISLIGARRFDRPDYSFRPGELLSDYLVHVDIEDKNVSREDRFEINHHGYRFWQSACYQKSNGELACISCHDPHVKPASKDFRAKVTGICLDCHKSQKDQHEPVLAKNNDCVSCHMPTRRTRDVVLVTMTDHRISRGPFDAEALVKPLKKKEPIITDLQMLPWGNPPTGDEAEIYKAVSVLRARSTANATRALQNALIRSRYPFPTPYLDLIEAQLTLHEYAEAEQVANFVLKSRPDLFSVYTWKGVAHFGQGRVGSALASLEKSLAIRPTPDAHYNYALVAFKNGQYNMALQHLDDAIALSQNFYPAWMYKGRINAELGRLTVARDAFIRCLEIEPNNEAVYVDLVRLLRRMKDKRAADRFLEVGLRVSKNPSKLEPLKSSE